MESQYMLDTTKEEGELSDDEEDIPETPQCYKIEHRSPQFRHTSNSKSNSTSQSNRYNHLRSRTSRPNTKTYPKSTKDGPSHYAKPPPKRSPPKLKDPQSKRQRNSHSQPTKDTDRNQAHTSPRLPNMAKSDTKENGPTVPSLLTMDIPIPASMRMKAAALPPSTPPLPKTPPPDKPEPAPVNLLSILPQIKPRKRKVLVKSVPVERAKSPPVGDIEDPNYIDLLLDYQAIKKQLDKISKVEQKTVQKEPAVHETGQDAGSVAVPGEDLEELPLTRDNEDLDILQLRLNALKSVGSEPEKVEAVPEPKQKRRLPFAPRDPHSIRLTTPKRRRYDSNVLRDSQGYTWEVPRQLPRRDYNSARRRSEERRKDAVDKRERRRRDEEKRRTEEKRLNEEYESNRRRLEVQKIVTLDDPKEQFKRFMELVAGVEKSTRSEVNVAEPKTAEDNYEEVAMDLDSEDDATDDPVVASLPGDASVFNLPKLDPHVIPGLDIPPGPFCGMLPLQDGPFSASEPVYRTDLVGPQILDPFYIQCPLPNLRTLLPTPEPPDQGPVPHIPGLGWSNEPTVPLPAEAEPSVLPPPPPITPPLPPPPPPPPPPPTPPVPAKEEDEEAMLRAKLLKSLMKRKKMQAEAELHKDSSPQLKDSSETEVIVIEAEPDLPGQPESASEDTEPSSAPEVDARPADLTVVVTSGPVSDTMDTDSVQTRSQTSDTEVSQTDDEPQRSLNESVSPKYHKVPRHEPVFIRINDDTDESDLSGGEEGSAPPPPATPAVSTPTPSGLSDMIGSFIREARMSVEAKAQEAAAPAALAITTPDVMKQMPRAKVAEYKKLQQRLRQAGVRAGGQNSGDKLPEGGSSADVTAADREKEEKEKEKKNRVLMIQLELVQQRHSLRVTRDTLSSVGHEITKKKAVLRMGEEHVRKLREQLAAAEKIVRANRGQLGALNEQAQDAQAHVDERMARVQALEAQLLSVGRQAYGDSFTPNMATSLMGASQRQGSNLKVTISKIKAPRQVVLPAGSSAGTVTTETATKSPVRKVVMKKAAGAKTVAVRAATQQAKKVAQPPAKALRTPADIAKEKARLMLLEKKYAAMIQRHKAAQASKQADPKPASPLPSPNTSGVWRSLSRRRRSSSYSRRDSGLEHVHTEEMMRVDDSDDVPPPAPDEGPGPGVDGAGPSVMDRLGDRVDVKAYKIPSLAVYNSVLKAYRSTLQKRFKDSMSCSKHTQSNSLMPKPSELPSQVLSSIVPPPAVSLVTVPRGDASLPYHSPLRWFRAYRLSPYYRTKDRLSLACLTFSHKINAQRPFCQYDLGGTCNDEKCRGQHSNQYALSREDILKDLAAYHTPMVTSDKTKMAAELAPFIEKFQKVNEKFTPDQQSLLLVSKVNETSQRNPPHTMATEPRPWRPKQKYDKSNPVVESNPNHKRGPAPPDPSDDLVVSEVDPRYWVSDLGATTTSALETEVMGDPNNVPLWITLANHKLHEAGHSAATCLEHALNVLARGLESNSSSVELWTRYLSLYSQRRDSSDIDSLYRQALVYTPSYALYWTYLQSCSSLAQKVSACQSALDFLVSAACTAPPAARSHALLEAAAHQMALGVRLGDARQEGGVKSVLSEAPPCPPDEAWPLLTPSDRALLRLVLLQVQLFGSVPAQLYSPTGDLHGRIVNKTVPLLPWSRLFTTLPPGPDHTASVDRVCRDTATVIQDAIDDVYRARGGAAPGGLDEISALYGCLIDLYLAAGRPAAAVEQCGLALECDFRRPDLYLRLLACTAKLHDYPAVREWYKQAFLHLPTCAKLYLAAADLEMQMGDADRALEILEECVLAMYVTENVDPASCDPNLMYCKLLAHTMPLNYRAPDLHPDLDQDELEQQQPEIWACYCLLLDLQGYSERASEAYEAAILTLRGATDLTMLWTRYLQHQLSQLQQMSRTHRDKGSREFTALVNRCLLCLPVRQVIPSRPGQTWLDYTPHMAVITSLVQASPLAEQAAVLEGYLGRMPHNIPLLLRSLEVFQKTGQLALMKGSCLSALLDHPRCLPLWNIYISLLQRENNVTEMRRAYRLATDALPLEANLWKDFAQFELIQGNESHMQYILDRCTDPEIRIEEWIQIWISKRKVNDNPATPESSTPIAGSSKTNVAINNEPKPKQKTLMKKKMAQKAKNQKTGVKMGVAGMDRQITVIKRTTDT